MAENGHAPDLSHAVIMPRQKRTFWEDVALWVGGIAGLFGMVWLFDRLGFVPDEGPVPETQPA